ncbi:hypothetical protein GCM10023342_23840 [Modicisalibacter zincidurans]|uniref:General stress protein FMN-binding split barrel domain-containing protein n=1 Tax=Modicisalibacter zincidurans TaxID=1178777 RepID=A0ABP9RGW0_9GAMM
MSSPEHKQKIWKLISDIKVGMLVTLDGPQPRARPMHLVQDAYDGTLWFYTRRSAERSSRPRPTRTCASAFPTRRRACMSRCPARRGSTTIAR